MVRHILKSGRTLEIQPAKFRYAKDLLDAVLKEVKSSRLDPKQEVDVNFIKDSLLGLISSGVVESFMWPCLASCIYEKGRITPDTFEDIQSREDFLEICYEVGKANIIPFGKNLYAELSPLLGNLELSLK